MNSTVRFFAMNFMTDLASSFSLTLLQGALRESSRAPSPEKTEAGEGWGGG